MKKTWVLAAVAICLIATAGAIALMNGSQTAKRELPQSEERPEDVLSYFIDSMTTEAKTTPDYGERGLGGGVDAFLLLQTYPRLEMREFQGVAARQGGYSMRSNELEFTGNLSSDSPLIEREGMRTLLQNISVSRSLEIKNKEDVDKLLRELRAKDYDLSVSTDLEEGSVTIATYALMNPGFVVVHADRPVENPGPVLGVSPLLHAGDGKNLQVVLHRAVESGERLYATIYVDNGDGKFDLATDVLAVNASGEPVTQWFEVVGSELRSRSL